MNPFAGDDDVVDFTHPSQHQTSSPWAPSTGQQGQTAHYGGNDLIDFQDQFGNPSSNIPQAQSAYMPSQPTLKHSDTFMTDGGTYSLLVYWGPDSWSGLKPWSNGRACFNHYAKPLCCFMPTSCG